METLKKCHNSKLSQALIIYLTHNEKPNPKGSIILFTLVQNEIKDMLNSDVIMPIIFSYVLTIVQMLKATENYDIIGNYQRIDKILELIFPDNLERKKCLAQLIAYCIK